MDLTIIKQKYMGDGFFVGLTFWSTKIFGYYAPKGVKAKCLECSPNVTEIISG